MFIGVYRHLQGPKRNFHKVSVYKSSKEGVKKKGVVVSEDLSRIGEAFHRCITRIYKLHRVLGFRFRVWGKRVLDLGL